MDTNRNVQIPVKVSYESNLLSDQGARYEFPKNSAILAKMSVLAIYVRVKPIYDMKH